MRDSQTLEVKVRDTLQPVTLQQAELSGEIGRRINDLIYKNYMALDLDGTFLSPFRTRPFADGWHYIGVGKVIDAGSLFAGYTGDAAVAERTTRLIGEVLKTRDADGFCCPGNFRRIVAELPQKVYYRTGRREIAVNLYTSSQTTLPLGGGICRKGRWR